MSETTQIWLDILQIIIPVLLIVGGGALAYWKFLQEQERKQVIHDAEISQAATNNKMKAEEASWKRVNETIEAQAKRIDHLEEDVRKLREENKILREMLRAAGLKDI